MALVSEKNIFHHRNKYTLIVAERFFVHLSNFRHKGTSGSELIAIDGTEKQSMNRKANDKGEKLFLGYKS